MGCGTSVHRKRLVEVEKVLAEKPTSERDEDLDQMKDCAEILKEIMSNLIDAGARDYLEMGYVEDLSSRILVNLESRIGPALLKDPNVQTLEGKIMEVARLLDSVRATKATTRIEDKLKPVKNATAAKAAALMKQFHEPLSKLVQSVTAASNLAVAVQQAVDVATKGLDNAAGQEPFAKALLGECIALKARVEEALRAQINANGGVFVTLKPQVERLDNVSSELAKAASVASPPDPVLPKLEQLVKDAATAVCTKELDAAQDALKKEEGAAACQSLIKMRPFWTYVKESHDMSSKLSLVFKLSEEEATKAFRRGLADGNEAMCNGIMEFATTLAQLREAFDLKIGDGERSLLETLAALKAGEVILDEETLAKIKALDETTQSKLETANAELTKDSGMNPNAILQSLTEIQACWSEAEDGVKVSDEARGSVAAAFETLRQRIGDACASAAADDNDKKLQVLLDFARKFNGVQEALSSISPGFLDFIMRAGADRDLLDCSQELAKDSGLNPQVILKSVKGLSAYWPELGDEAPSYHARLGEVCEKVHARIMDAFDKDPENTKKRAALVQFAKQFDAIAAGIEGAGEPNLAAKLEEKGGES
eukprot:TRINITY_DN101303_c0_g1_i1.p1 TRINITY_DN101303_c0_g1~~TRINITY_DN101303_c0_g1_i1.p1  ORF type:complete len:598 (+),score=168.40 TRINITY_DN101303_c0_g1_i1:142-1935(+)